MPTGMLFNELCRHYYLILWQTFLWNQLLANLSAIVTIAELASLNIDAVFTLLIAVSSPCHFTPPPRFTFSSLACLLILLPRPPFYSTSSSSVLHVPDVDSHDMHVCLMKLVSPIIFLVAHPFKLFMNVYLLFFICLCSFPVYSLIPVVLLLLPTCTSFFLQKIISVFRIWRNC